MDHASTRSLKSVPTSPTFTLSKKNKRCKHCTCALPQLKNQSGHGDVASWWLAAPQETVLLAQNQHALPTPLKDANGANSASGFEEMGIEGGARRVLRNEAQSSLKVCGPRVSFVHIQGEGNIISRFEDLDLEGEELRSLRHVNCLRCLLCQIMEGTRGV